MTKSLHYNLASLVGTEMRAEEVRSLLAEFVAALEPLSEGTLKTKDVDRVVREIAGKRDSEAVEVLRPLRVIIPGLAGSHDLYETMAIMGKDQVVQMIKGAVLALSDRA